MFFLLILVTNFECDFEMTNNILSNNLGCDSIVNTVLTVLPINLSSQNMEICVGDSVIITDDGYEPITFFPNSIDEVVIK